MARISKHSKSGHAHCPCSRKYDPSLFATRLCNAKKPQSRVNTIPRSTTGHKQDVTQHQQHSEQAWSKFHLHVPKLQKETMHCSMVHVHQNSTVTRNFFANEIILITVTIAHILQLTIIDFYTTGIGYISLMNFVTVIGVKRTDKSA